MSEIKNKEDSFNLLMTQWVHASEGGGYQEAILYAIFCYLLSRERKDARAEIGALGALEATCKQIMAPLIEKRKGEKQQEISCSFCGRSEPEVKLAAGPHAFICNNCVNDLSKMFSGQK